MTHSTTARPITLLQMDMEGGELSFDLAMQALARICSLETLAAVMNDLLGADAEPHLNDIEAEAAETILESLVDHAPDAARFAQGLA